MMIPIFLYCLETSVISRLIGERFYLTTTIPKLTLFTYLDEVLLVSSYKQFLSTYPKLVSR